MKISLTIVFILYTLLCINICQADENKEIELYNEAQNLMDKYGGDTSILKKTKKIIQEIERITPNSKYALVCLGRLTYKKGYLRGDEFQQGALNQSLMYFNKAISYYPDFADAYYYSASAHIYNKDYEQAEELVHKAQKLDPDIVKTSLALGEISKRKGDYEATIKHAQIILENNPKDLDFDLACNMLTTAYEELKHYDKARAVYLKQVERFPESAWARSNYSFFLRRYMKEYDEAIVQGQKALELMNFGMGHKVLGDAYYAKASQMLYENKEYEQSIHYFSSALKHLKNSQIYYGLGMAHFLLGSETRDISQLHQAEEAFKSALKRNKNHRGATMQLHSIQEILSRYSQ